MPARIHEVEPCEHGVLFRSEGLYARAGEPCPLETQRRRGSRTFRLREGETAVFVLRQAPDGPTWPAVPPRRKPRAVRTDRAVLAEMDFTVPVFRPLARHRAAAALTLKLLTFEPTGAIVAAPTCSLPELIGGPRTGTIGTPGSVTRPSRSMACCDSASRPKPPISWAGSTPAIGKPSTGAHTAGALPHRRRARHPETTLDHLDGYKGSRPVRIGNKAHRQLQLDIYGELLDSVYLFNKYGSPISYEGGRTCGPARWLCDNWQTPGRRHLGGPGREARICLFQAHVLGRHRSRPAAGR